MIDANDSIPTAGTHRGVPLHAGQCERRVAVVRRELDRVFALESNVDELLAFAANPKNAPEARLFAGAKLEALDAAAAASREARPIDPDKLRAILAGLDSTEWRDPNFYGSDLELGRGTPRDPLDEPLP